jgi:hypothetical protein
MAFSQRLRDVMLILSPKMPRRENKETDHRRDWKCEPGNRDGESYREISWEKQEPPMVAESGRE